MREVYGHLQNAQAPTFEVGSGTCCYAHSEKTWITDPQGVAWEAFLTMGESPNYGTDVDVAAASAGPCCPTADKAPATASSPCC